MEWLSSLESNRFRHENCVEFPKVITIMISITKNSNLTLVNSLSFPDDSIRFFHTILPV